MKVFLSLLCAALCANSAEARNPESEFHGQRTLPDSVTNRDYYDDGAPSPAKVELGRLLFFDPILSGNRNISCATCHHPSFGTSDEVSLSLGEGAKGLGPDRISSRSHIGGVYERIPRNSPALFNLGAREYTVLFHDGRVEVDKNAGYESGFISPARWKLPRGLSNALAAQAMFPVTSPAEMAGQQGENPIADARARNQVGGEGGVWDLLTLRLRSIPEYKERFSAAFPSEVRITDDIDMVLAANAIAAFEAHSFRADQSPFDRYLRGDENALSSKEVRGMNLFYGKASCSACHSGKFQTDHGFHAIAMPQVGPGKSDGWDSGYWSKSGYQAFPEDQGRGRVTGRIEDNYRFRTPSLRNVALTAPYGHSGAYPSLEEVVRHHLQPVATLHAYDGSAASLPPLNFVLEHSARGSSFLSSTP